MRELVVCLLLCLAILAPRAASALETGVIEARSARYEPLDARIALHDVQAGDIGEIEVTLGSRSQFEIAGVARPFHLTLIEFTVVEQEDGLAYIQLWTDDPIIEPSLTFLINVDWPRGHAIRGYNLKLSQPTRGTTGASASRRTAPEGKREPEAAPTAPASSTPEPSTLGGITDAAATPAPSTSGGITDAPAAPAPSTSGGITDAAATPAPSTSGGIADAAATPAPARAPGAASPGQASTALVIRTADAAAPGSPRPASSHTADGGTYGPVRPTDTLWAIASRFRPDDSISVHRMMLAFVEANPQAFDRGNVNGLNAGVIPAHSGSGRDRTRRPGGGRRGAAPEPGVEAEPRRAADHPGPRRARSRRSIRRLHSSRTGACPAIAGYRSAAGWPARSRGAGNGSGRRRPGRRSRHPGVAQRARPRDGGRGCETPRKRRDRVTPRRSGEAHRRPVPSRRAEGRRDRGSAGGAAGRGRSGAGAGPDDAAAGSGAAGGGAGAGHAAGSGEVDHRRRRRPAAVRSRYVGDQSGVPGRRRRGVPAAARRRGPAPSPSRRGP